MEQLTLPLPPPIPTPLEVELFATALGAEVAAYVVERIGQTKAYGYEDAVLARAAALTLTTVASYMLTGASADLAFVRADANKLVRNEIRSNYQ